ncbi:Uncharacterised protein [Zhongshania aliphaticivorans]|nr:Uncharacterised protein [Zhongshania aliphaticivorans]
MPQYKLQTSLQTRNVWQVKVRAIKKAALNDFSAAFYIIKSPDKIKATNFYFSFLILMFTTA